MHRSAILAELLGMVERWIAAGTPRAKVSTRFESKGWGSDLGGILDVAGEPDFLANVDAVSEELDPVRREFGGLVEAMARLALGTEWNASELPALQCQSRTAVQ